MVGTTAAKWDGVASTLAIEVPIVSGMLLAAVSNQSGRELTATCDYLVDRYADNARAQIGSGTDGVVTITHDVPGREGDTFTVLVRTLDEPGPLSAFRMEGQLTILLAVDDEGPIDEENTAALVAAAINDGAREFTAVASGSGSGVVEEIDAPVPFTGGMVDVWAPLYGLDDQKVSLTIPDDSFRVYELPRHFPRFLGGRLTLTAASAPAVDTTTWVRVVASQ